MADAIPGMPQSVVQGLRRAGKILRTRQAGGDIPGFLEDAAARAAAGAAAGGASGAGLRVRDISRNPAQFMTITRSNPSEPYKLKFTAYPGHHARLTVVTDTLGTLWWKHEGPLRTLTAKYQIRLVPGSEHGDARVSVSTDPVPSSDPDDCPLHDRRDQTTTVMLSGFRPADASLLRLHTAQLDRTIQRIVSAHRAGLEVRIGEISGYASQTGSEAVNRKVAQARAVAVRGYLRRKLTEKVGSQPVWEQEFGRMLAKGYGSNPELTELTGFEDPCARSVVFSVTIEEVRQLNFPYTRKEAEQRYRSRLEHLKAGGDDPPWAPGELKLERKDAKVTYAILINWLNVSKRYPKLDPLRDNWRIDENGVSLAYGTLCDEFPGGWWRSLEGQVSRWANQARAIHFYDPLGDNDRLKAGEKKRGARDPYYYATFHITDGVRTRADAIAKQYFGDAVDWGYEE